MTRTVARSFIVEIASSGPTSQNRRNDPNNDRGIRADKRARTGATTRTNARPLIVGTVASGRPTSGQPPAKLIDTLASEQVFRSFSFMPSFNAGKKNFSSTRPPTHPQH